jgi:hypothetical protein
VEDVVILTEVGLTAVGLTAVGIMLAGGAAFVKLFDTAFGVVVATAAAGPKSVATGEFLAAAGFCRDATLAVRALEACLTVLADASRC